MEIGGLRSCELLGPECPYYILNRAPDERRIVGLQRIVEVMRNHLGIIEVFGCVEGTGLNHGDRPRFRQRGVFRSA